MTELIPMIFVSLLSGLLSTMNLWTVNRSHIRFHLNDLYMILLMTGWMIFFGNLIPNHNNHQHESPQHVGSTGLFGFFIPLIFVIVITMMIRDQTFVSDGQFIKGMIPHHSMAIRMADKILKKTNNKQIKQLARNIIKQQNAEINLMQRLEQTV
jgi:hypothetical protein